MFTTCKRWWPSERTEHISCEGLWWHFKYKRAGPAQGREQCIWYPAGWHGGWGGVGPVRGFGLPCWGREANRCPCALGDRGRWGGVGSLRWSWGRGQTTSQWALWTRERPAPLWTAASQMEMGRNQIMHPTLSHTARPSALNTYSHADTPNDQSALTPGKLCYEFY